MEQVSPVVSAAWLVLAVVSQCDDLRAQDVPSRPIRFIVPYLPGGGTDLLARTIGQKLTQMRGQQVPVDSRPGASAMIGNDLAAKAAPDGCTILLGFVGSISISPSLLRWLPYEQVLSLADVRSQLASMGRAVTTGNPGEFAACIKAEIAKWAKVVRESGAGIDQRHRIGTPLLRTWPHRLPALLSHGRPAIPYLKWETK